MKKGFFVLGVVCLLIFNILPFVESALGITPAIKEIDFTPGFSTSFDYKVKADLGKEITLYAEGELAKYVSFDTTVSNGSGNFKVDINLPNEIEKPGEHKIYIVVEEAIDEELVAIGTRIIIKGVIKVYVPYPGRYLEISSFESNDANIGDSVYFELNIKNFGKEDVGFVPKIEIRNQEKQFATH